MKNYSPLLTSVLHSIFTQNCYTDYLKLLAQTYHKRTRDEILLTEHWQCFDYRLLLEAVRSASSTFIILTSDKKSGRGFYRIMQNTIYVNADQSTAMMLATAIQGITYSRIYHSEHYEKDMNIVSLEAESAAFIISFYFGLDIGTEQFNDIANQVAEMSALELNEILYIVQGIAFDIINRIMKLYEQMIQIDEKLLAKSMDAILQASPRPSVADIKIKLPARNVIGFYREKEEAF